MWNLSEVPRAFSESAFFVAMKLNGKVALITGASRGIGRSVAEGFAREGAKLFLVGQTDEEALRQTLADIRRLGTEAEGGLYDVGNHDEVKRIADASASATARSIS